MQANEAKTISSRRLERGGFSARRRGAARQGRTGGRARLRDGSGELTVRYAKFGDMLAALEDFDTLRAMAELDARARLSGRKARG